MSIGNKAQVMWVDVRVTWLCCSLLSSSPTDQYYLIVILHFKWENNWRASSARQKYNKRTASSLVFEKLGLNYNAADLAGTRYRTTPKLFQEILKVTWMLTYKESNYQTIILDDNTKCISHWTPSLQDDDGRYTSGKRLAAWPSKAKEFWDGVWPN